MAGTHACTVHAHTHARVHETRIAHEIAVARIACTGDPQAARFIPVFGSRLRF